MLLLGTLIGAIGFRLRGSAIFEEITGRGATTARIVCWAIPMGLFSLIHVPPMDAVWIGLGFFLGACPGWYHCTDLGRDDGKVVRDYVVMTIRGLVWTILPAIVMSYFNPTAAGAMVLAGALCPLAYTIGWAIPSNIKGLHQGPELGEFIFGGIIGASIVL